MEKLRPLPKRKKYPPPVVEDPSDEELDRRAEEIWKKKEVEYVPEQHDRTHYC